MDDNNSEIDWWSDIQSSIDSESISDEVVEPYDFNNLPPYACAYCGVHNTECVVKCVHKDCNKWFCNGKGVSEYGSHALLHMVKAKHKEIQLH